MRRLTEEAVLEHGLPDPLDRFSYDAGEMRAPTEATARSGFELVEDCDPRAGGVGGGVRGGFHNVPMLVGTEPGASLSFSCASDHE